MCNFPVGMRNIDRSTSNVGASVALVLQRHGSNTPLDGSVPILRDATLAPTSSVIFPPANICDKVEIYGGERAQDVVAAAG